MSKFSVSIKQYKADGCPVRWNFIFHGKTEEKKLKIKLKITNIIILVNKYFRNILLMYKKWVIKFKIKLKMKL